MQQIPIRHLRCSALLRVKTSISQLRDVKSIVSQVVPEPDVFQLDGILLDVRDEEESDDGGKDTERGGDVEGVLGGLIVVAASFLYVREDVRANECPDLADSCSNTIVFASDRLKGAKC